MLDAQYAAGFIDPAELTRNRSSFPQVAPEGSLPGHPGFLTDDQTTKLEALRVILKELGYEKRMDDATLVSFVDVFNCALI